MTTARLAHTFVDCFPDQLEPGTVYVSIPYATVAHLCCCGCGNEAVTPLGRAEWKLTFDGESISLHPSIGNWSFPCRSHYWIRNNTVHWARRWSDKQIAANRSGRGAVDDPHTPAGNLQEAAPVPAERRLTPLLRWLNARFRH
ncbi:DUF6527 family protein [Streptomyces sp. NRRL F-525]|uniref:DUF6527 family protein n=1 Tax=Streptomyces sp. NRRL F-525 TaxID=1463861 RepID=UPI000998CB38|nr:DUF6527 family protein [Streptomyces sp. NRRL F-525]